MMVAAVLMGLNRFLIHHILALHDNDAVAPTQEELLSLTAGAQNGGGCCK